MSNSALTIEITFEKWVSATTTTANPITPSVFTVKDVYFTASMLNFSQEITDALDK